MNWEEIISNKKHLQLKGHVITVVKEYEFPKNINSNFKTSTILFSDICVAIEYIKKTLEYYQLEAKEDTTFPEDYSCIICSGENLKIKFTIDYIGQPVYNTTLKVSYGVIGEIK